MDCSAQNARIKERFKVASAKEAEDMATATTVKSRASVSRVTTGIKGRNSDAIKNRQNIKMRKDAKKAYTKSQEAMKATAKNSYRTAKAGSNAIKRISHSVAHLNTKVLVSAIIAGGWVAVIVVVCCVMFGAAKK